MKILQVAKKEAIARRRTVAAIIQAEKGYTDAALQKIYWYLRSKGGMA